MKCLVFKKCCSSIKVTKSIAGSTDPFHLRLISYEVWDFWDNTNLIYCLILSSYKHPSNIVTERGKEEDKSHTWWAVPAGTQASVCSQEWRWSPAWVAFLIPSDAQPLSSSFSVRSGRERVFQIPAPAAPAGPSPGAGGEDASLMNWSYRLNKLVFIESLQMRVC